MSGFRASGSGGMSGLSGARRGSPTGSKSNVTRVFPLTSFLGLSIIYSMRRKKNPHAQALGSLGGKARAKSLSQSERAEIARAGGKARAAKLTAAERKRIARAAVAARERKREDKVDA